MTKQKQGLMSPAILVKWVILQQSSPQKTAIKPYQAWFSGKSYI
jgi:hypothetical protein